MVAVSCKKDIDEVEAPQGNIKFPDAEFGVLLQGMDARVFRKFVGEL